MLSKIVFVALILLCFVKEANAQNKNINKISDKYYHLIEAPTSADKWDGWRLSLRTWRDSTLKFINYKGDNYQNDHYKWASKAYNTYFLTAAGLDRCATVGFRCVVDILK